MENQKNFQKETLHDTPVKDKASSPQESTWKELLRFAFITALIVIPIRLFIAQPFLVSGGSMDPTFADGQYLIVDELSYRFNPPERGDVVIFRFPFNQRKFLIKRVIGLPGETVKIENGVVTIKNSAMPDGFTLAEPFVSFPKTDDRSGSLQLKADEYFVMGDNRGASVDSRIWGALKKEHIIGKPFLRLFPLKTLDFAPGVHNY